jgi:hypothetical protein
VFLKKKIPDVRSRAIRPDGGSGGDGGQKEMGFLLPLPLLLILRSIQLLRLCAIRLLLLLLCVYVCVSEKENTKQPKPTARVQRESARDGNS